jgi:hypothetical protein
MNNDIKECKFCRTEIPKKAIICPYCKKDLRNFILRHPIISFLLLIIFLPGVFSWVNDLLLLDSTNNNNFSSKTIDKKETWSIYNYVDKF